MATRPVDEFHNVRDLADRLMVSQSYLGKILQKLVHQGFLDSVTGPHGGFRLAINPKKITLMDLIIAIDGEKIFDPCILGLASCDDSNPCPVHFTWKKCKGVMKDEFKNTTVHDARTHSWPKYLKMQNPKRKSK
jgi:Rrf2 family protein